VYKRQTLPHAPLVSIDMARTAELNARFRMVRETEIETDFATQRRQDLAFWRESRAADLAKNNVALMRRVKAEDARRRKRTGIGIGANSDPTRISRFADKRRDQLRRWRLSSNSSADAS